MLVLCIPVGKIAFEARSFFSIYHMLILVNFLRSFVKSNITRRTFRALILTESSHRRLKFGLRLKEKCSSNTRLKIMSAIILKIA